MPPSTATSNDEVTLASWVHISDIHFGHGDAGHQWDQPLVLDDLRRDIREVMSRGTVPPPRHVFLTGDVAFSGGARPPAAGATEYGLARAWLDELLADLKLERDRLFVVPGNHDVDRAMDLDVKGMLKHARAHEPDFRLDELLGKPEQVGRLTQRMARFLEFASSYGPLDTERFHGGLWWVHRGELEAGVSLRICGLNTATLSVDDTDQGRLRIGNRQLNDLLMPAPDALEVVLVLGHHPPTDKWLADEKTVRGRLDAVEAVHLFGHLHEAGTSQRLRGAGGGSLQIAAGAAHAEAAAPGAPPVGHGYNFGALVMLPGGKLVVRIWPRTWTSDPPRFVTHSHIIDDARGYAEHPLRHVIPRPPQPAPTGPHPLPGPSAIQADQLLGQRYLLKTKLGEGGVGQVWEALDTRAGNEPVALKILNPTGAPSPPARREAFFRGPRSMARVDHPAIVHVRDPEPNPTHALGPYDYYVMDLVNGQDLSRTYKGKSRSDEQTVTLMIAIAEGLAAAHFRGLIHRDLKPSNVLIDADGNIKIVDFDTVKDLRDSTQTRTSERLVSDLYASPEVLDGLTTGPESVIGVGADIYSLAVTGIFLLRGEDPPKTSINRMHAAVAALPCSDGLRKVLHKACEFERDKRHASTNELLTELRALEGYEDIDTYLESLDNAETKPRTTRKTQQIVVDDDDPSLTNFDPLPRLPPPNPEASAAPKPAQPILAVRKAAVTNSSSLNDAATVVPPLSKARVRVDTPPTSALIVDEVDEPPQVRDVAPNKTANPGPGQVVYSLASPVWAAIVATMANLWYSIIDRSPYRAGFVATGFLVLALFMNLSYPVEPEPRGLVVAQTPDTAVPQPTTIIKPETAAVAVEQPPESTANAPTNPWLGPGVTGKVEELDSYRTVSIQFNDGSYLLRIKGSECEIRGSLKLTDAGDPDSLKLHEGCSYEKPEISFTNISSSVKFSCSTRGGYITCKGRYRQSEAATLNNRGGYETGVSSDYVSLRIPVQSHD